MNELDAQQQVARGHESAAIIGNRMVVDAINAMRADLYYKLESTKWYQKGARESIYHQLKACENFEAQFRYHIDNGKLAASWLEERRALQDLKRSRRKA